MTGGGAAEPWLVVFNPAAGNARRREQLTALERALQAAGVALEIVATSAPRDGERIAREAVLAGRRKLLIAGGDGSAHDVVNGVMSTGVELARSVLLGFAPLGTGNDWARTLGLPRDPAQLAAAIARAETIAHDVGVIDFAPHGRAARRWFVNVAGAGYDSFVISSLPAQVPSRLAYLSGAVAGLLRYHPPRFLIDDAGRTFDERLWVVFVANARYCGNSMHVAPHARIDDGRLVVVAVDALHPLRVLGKLRRLYDGSLARDPAVRSFATERLRIDATPVTAVEADGQIVGSTPVEIGIEPGALRVVVAAAASALNGSAGANR
jgi:YegS/Rv2252/BmrU family lipid kinase